MKIIEGLKQIKDLARKAEDLRTKIKTYCADMANETPVYENEEKQRQQIAGWLQAHSDICKEILRLRIALQRTNLAATATIEIGGKAVTKTLAEWILRRGPGKKMGEGLASMEGSAYFVLSPGNRTTQAIRTADPAAPQVITVRRYYEQAHRDKMVELFASEPAAIDAALEIANATTDLVFE